MTHTTITLLFTLGAPTLGDAKTDALQFVPVLCISIDQSDKQIAYTFILQTPTGQFDLERSTRFAVTSTMPHAEVGTDLPSYLRAANIKPGDKLHWLVHRPAKELEARTMLTDWQKVLPKPDALLRPTGDDETAELVRVLNASLKLTTDKERREFIKREQGTKNKRVEEYLVWLGKKLQTDTVKP